MLSTKPIILRVLRTRRLLAKTKVLLLQFQFAFDNSLFLQHYFDNNRQKMGCDGGTIPTRDELVKTRKKPEQVRVVNRANPT